MDLRAQSEGQSSPGGGAADVLSTAASTVRDVLHTQEQPQAEGAVQTVARRLPRSAHAPLYEAVHAAAEAVETVEEKAGGLMRKKDQLIMATTQYVDAAPLQAVGMAFAAGWIIGRITR